MKYSRSFQEKERTWCLMMITWGPRISFEPFCKAFLNHFISPVKKKSSPHHPHKQHPTLLWCSSYPNLLILSPSPLFMTIVHLLFSFLLFSRNGYLIIHSSRAIVFIPCSSSSSSHAINIISISQMMMMFLHLLQYPSVPVFFNLSFISCRLFLPSLCKSWGFSHLSHQKGLESERRVRNLLKLFLKYHSYDAEMRHDSMREKKKINIAISLQLRVVE